MKIFPSILLTPIPPHKGPTFSVGILETTYKYTGAQGQLLQLPQACVNRIAIVIKQWAIDAYKKKNDVGEKTGKERGGERDGGKEGGTEGLTEVEYVHVFGGGLKRETTYFVLNPKRTSVICMLSFPQGNKKGAEKRMDW